MSQFLKIALIACTLVLGGCFETVSEQTRSTVYLIGTEDGNGSGVLIAPGIILTAAHVASHPDLYVEPSHKKLTLIKSDPDHDIAIMKVEGGLDCPCAKLGSKEDLVQDGQVFIIGFPLHNSVGVQTLTEGRLQGMIEGDKLVTTAPAAPGNSGGGLFTDSGKLIGILVAVPGFCAPQAFMYPICTPVYDFSFSESIISIIEFLKGDVKS